jgi:glycosyltransferase involved in cell wall biosynthesis
MKILLVCENYYPHLGGAEVVFQNLAERLAKRGDQVTVITQLLPGTKKKEIINGTRILRINSFNSRYLFTFFSIFRIIKEARQSDIIQTTTFNAAFPSWLASKISRRPVVLTVHEVWTGRWQEVTGYPPLKSKIHDLLERSIYLFPFDRYICVSEATRKDLLKVIRHPNKTLTIYNGFDSTRWSPYPEEERDSVNSRLRRSLGFEDNKIIFSWGRPGPSKGFEYLIQAFPHILKEIPSACLLLLLGSSEKYPKKYQELLTLIAKLNLANQIKIIRSSPQNHRKEYLALADLVVVPSISEGFGYTTLEASSAGKTVIASDTGSIPEVIGGKYLLFEKKNILDLSAKVIQALQDPSSILPKPTKNFDWEKTIDGYQQTYQELTPR